MIVAFAGHAFVPSYEKVKQIVKESLGALASPDEVLTCYLGGYGDFDRIALSACQELKKEYDILKNLQHPGIVNCFDYICDANYAAILMEELNPLLGMEQSYIQALNYCHTQGFLHRDIRLNNLGTDTSGNGKLFDFGNASAIKSQQEKQREIELLKNIMRSPVAQERKVSCRGDVLC